MNHSTGHGFSLRYGPGDAPTGSTSIILALGASGIKVKKRDGKEMGLGDEGNNVFIWFSDGS
jgi:hypothetical protein